MSNNDNDTSTAIQFKVIHSSAMVPERANAGDAGFDLASIEDVVVPPLERVLVGTGIAVSIPQGWTGLVCPRSGLALKFGVSSVNSPGVIDSGYRGEIKVIVHNTDSKNAVQISVGDRIAQLVPVPIWSGSVEVVEDLESSSRADDGFGSTGMGNVSANVGESNT